MNGKSDRPISFSVSFCICGRSFKLISFTFVCKRETLGAVHSTQLWVLVKYYTQVYNSTHQYTYIRYTYRAAHHVLITCYTLHLRKQPTRAARITCLVAMVKCDERTRNLNPPIAISKIHVFLQKRPFVTFHYYFFTKV